MPAMLRLSNPADKTIRVQIAESVSLIAQLDFPEQWPDLIDVSPVVSHLRIWFSDPPSQAIGCIIVC